MQTRFLTPAFVRAVAAAPAREGALALDGRKATEATPDEINGSGGAGLTGEARS